MGSPRGPALPAHPRGIDSGGEIEPAIFEALEAEIAVGPAGHVGDAGFVAVRRVVCDGADTDVGMVRDGAGILSTHQRATKPVRGQDDLGKHGCAGTRGRQTIEMHRARVGGHISQSRLGAWQEMRAGVDGGADESGIESLAREGNVALGK